MRPSVQLAGAGFCLCHVLLFLGAIGDCFLFIAVAPLPPPADRVIRLRDRLFRDRLGPPRVWKDSYYSSGGNTSATSVRQRQLFMTAVSVWHAPPPLQVVSPCAVGAATEFSPPCLTTHTSLLLILAVAVSAGSSCFSYFFSSFLLRR